MLSLGVGASSWIAESMKVFYEVRVIGHK
jgi:hypothetical protein